MYPELFNRVFASLNSNSKRQLFADFIEAHYADTTREKRNRPQKILDSIANLEKTMNENEKRDFKFLRENFSVEFLGGGNSRNFLITEALTNTRFVVKIENPLGLKLISPERIKAIDVFLSSDNRQDYRTEKNTHQSLVLMDYLPDGDIDTFCDKLHGDDKIAFVTDVSLQIASSMKQFQANQLIMTDIKNSNILYNSETKTIHIADIKSVRETKDGFVVGNLISTTGFYHKDDAFNSINAEAFHAYILGRNIYQLLTGCSDVYLRDNPNLKYDNEIFKTPEGEIFGGLITALTLDNPQERPKMDIVINTLNRIRIHLSESQLSNKCFELQNIIKILDPGYKVIPRDELKTTQLFALKIIEDNLYEKLKLNVTEKKQLENYSINDVVLYLTAKQEVRNIAKTSPRLAQDKIMEIYVRDMERKLEDCLIANNKVEIAALNKELKQVCANLNSTGPALIREQINYFRERSTHVFSRGGNLEKAKAIATQFMSYDIEMRVTAHQQSDMQAALNKQRISISKKDSTTFKQFKAKLQNHHIDSPSVKKQENGYIPPESSNK